MSTGWRCCRQHYNRQHRDTCQIHWGHHDQHHRPENWSTSCWHGVLCFPYQTSRPCTWRFITPECRRWASGHQRMRSSHGTPVRNSRGSHPSTRMKSNGLKTELWCTPTVMANSSLYWSLIWTRLRALECIHWMTNTAHPLTPGLLKAHHSTLLCRRTEAFSKLKMAK